MKPVNLFIVISFLCLSTGCSKDDAAENILGKWYPQNAVQNLYENGNKYSSTSYEASEKTFNADGTGLMTTGDSYSNPFSWKLEADTLTITMLTGYGVETTSVWSVLDLDDSTLRIKNTMRQTAGSNQEYITESIETYRK